MSFGVVSVLTCVVFTVFAYGWLFRKLHGAGTKLSYIISMGVALGGGLVAVVPIHLHPAWYHPAVSIVGAVLLAVGLIGTLRSDSPSWFGMALEDTVMAASATLLCASTGLLLVNGTLTQPTKVKVLVAMLLLISSLVIRRLATTRWHIDRFQAIAITCVAALGLFAQLCAISQSIAPHPALANAGLALAGLFVVSIASYALTRVATSSFTPIRVQPNPKPGHAHFVVGVLGIAATQYGHLTGKIPVSWFMATLVSIFILGNMLRVILAMKDYRALHTEAEESAHYYRSLVQNATDVFVICCPKSLLVKYASPAAQDVLGLSSDQVVGKPLHFMAGATAPACFELAAHMKLSGKEVRIEGTKDGKELETILTEHGTDILATIRDVTERQQLRENVHRMAFEDALTGLANRNQIHDVLVNRLQRPDEPLSLLMVDMDRFKQVNDSGGHELGDVVLGQVGQRLRMVADPGTILGRLGGDEFVAIVDPAVTDVEQFAQRIAHELGAPFEVSGRTFQLGGSVGIAHAVDTADASEVLRRADIAMFAAKRNKRGVQVYEPGLSREALSDVERDALIAHVLRARRFKLFGQPVVNLSTGTVASVETLIRWVDDDGLCQGPWPLINFAQRTGQLRSITDWVLHKACTTLQLSGGGVRLGVNVPPEDLLDPMLPQRLHKELTAAGITTHDLTIEITEDELIGTAHERTGVLRELHAMNMPLLIDDFGSGFSSLGYLVDLPISGFKIDRAFVTALPHSSRARSIVSSLIELAKTHDLDLIAEGIETAAEHEWLQRLGCPKAQGFFYGMPQDLDSIDDLSDLSCWTERTVESLALLQSTFEQSEVTARLRLGLSGGTSEAN